MSLHLFEAGQKAPAVLCLHGNMKRMTGLKSIVIVNSRAL